MSDELTLTLTLEDLYERQNGTSARLTQLMKRLDTDLQLPDLLRQLRASGVTRYKRGDLEIELSTIDVSVRELMRAWPRPAADSPAPTESNPVELGGPPPVDEKPPVEIDMAATEELIRRHDERRRGPSQ